MSRFPPQDNYSSGDKANDIVDSQTRRAYQQSQLEVLPRSSAAGLFRGHWGKAEWRNDERI